MQIVGKVRNATFDAARVAIAACVQQAVPDSIGRQVVVRPLFPGVTTGRRAAMFIVDVPDEAESGLVTSLIAALRCEESVEYAEVPAERRAT